MKIVEITEKELENILAPGSEYEGSLSFVEGLHSYAERLFDYPTSLGWGNTAEFLGWRELFGDYALFVIIDFFEKDGVLKYLERLIVKESNQTAAIRVRTLYTAKEGITKKDIEEAYFAKGIKTPTRT